MTSSQSCPITAMSTDASTFTLVEPGSGSRCINNDSPFQFQVWPGPSDKVLLYFQGGGACWDEATTSIPICTQSAAPTTGDPGVFCRSDCHKPNKFEDFTIVQILYCTGDAHIGDTVRPYTDDIGLNITQTGVANVRATLD
jgi:hypothetical protein